jgi:hypothetical protein
VVDLLSEVGNEPGGGAKSLKVVRASDWLADVWILSRLREKCSLSACEDTESEVVESRRDREFTGEGGTDGPRDGCRRPPVLVLAIVPYFVQGAMDGCFQSSPTDGNQGHAFAVGIMNSWIRVLLLLGGAQGAARLWAFRRSKS